MHEQAIARNIIAQASVHGKIIKLNVECGELAPLAASELEKALRSLVSFDVQVFETPAAVECRCGFQGRPNIAMHSHDALAYFCPDCGKMPKILKGNEIVLASITIE